MTAERQQPEKQQPDPEELREDIQQTREELGATVEALAEKADVKTQAQQKVDEVKAEATTQVQQNRTPLIAAGVALLLLILIRRARRD
jgi:uncharacterized protein YoxC